MKRAIPSICVAVLFISGSEKPIANEKLGGPAPIPAFSLKDTHGRTVSSADFKDKSAIAVTFLGTECPVNNAYLPRLKKLHEEFASKGVQFLGINSNSQDAPERVAEHATTYKLPFPMLKDFDGRVADLFKAAATPEVFVLDNQGVVRYRGRIDDQFGVGYQRPKPTRDDLAEALKEVLAGKPVSVASTRVSGCAIGRAKEAGETGEITYNNQVVRILQNRCQECHRSGQIAPFALMTYKQARGWADTIRTVVNDNRMPPWHADPRYGKFANNRSLSKEERDTLFAWIDQGCPKGDDKDLPPPKQFRASDGWTIGKPDVVLTMKEEVKIPAQGGKYGVPYKYYKVPTNFEKDVWVQAAEAKPGNRAVVHHIIVFIVNPAGKEREEGRGDGIGGDHLVGTAPGDMPLLLPTGLAKKLPKGSNLIFQMHYTPNGTEQTDRSSVGLILAKEPPVHVARTRAVAQNSLAIPPGDNNYLAVSKTVFKKDALLLSFMPHMHLRGKDFEYKVTYPDGRSEILLSVPRYDFAWQSTYRFETPVRLPAGTKMECTAHFDNSTGNLNNPDPTKKVYWGDQTWEEMMIGWMNYYEPDDKVSQENKKLQGE